ncbi:hypothetical protein C8D97_10636 [Pleionea mediterranea]|uniref:Uncharacterized protein n=1 Tax=Pleionea mediterranea TaxID=523701 RepID=A0A316FQ50_9GAMM|nr:hypothetical protein [Pleionea mediterranea]PWK50749.1 hypothetical protein C8D97_10636 [Pleionea mediterranea]
MDNYNYEALCEIIGQEVVVEDSQGNAVSLKLSDVNKGKIDGEEWEAFSVIYQGGERILYSSGNLHS